MNSWLDYQARFRELIPAFRGIRLDAQTGADGEFWRLAGGYNRTLFDQFEQLCRLAGTRLTEVCNGNPAYDLILDDPDPMIRWYRAMKEQPGVFRNVTPMYSEDSEGRRAWSYLGEVADVPETAANLCLQLHRTHPIEEPEALRPSLFSRLGSEIAIPVFVAVLSGTAMLVIGWILGNYWGVG